jgi:protein-disulfide isomerase
MAWILWTSTFGHEEMNRPGNFELAVAVNETDHTQGAAHARATLVEYGDFECPNCKQAAAAVRLMLAHFNDGLRFVFRHFPLAEVHPHALLAAQAAEAAGAQGEFWPMHDLLFENQSRLELDQLRAYARRLELDMTRYDFETAEELYVQRIREHIGSGIRSGVHSTPTFFINGLLCDVSYGFQPLERGIEAALSA